MNQLRLKVAFVVAGLVCAVVSASCDASRSIEANAVTVQGTWTIVHHSSDSSEQWRLTITADSVRGQGSWSVGRHEWGTVEAIGHVSGNSLHIEFDNVTANAPSLPGDIVVTDAGVVDLALDSQGDLVGFKHDRDGTTSPVRLHRTSTTTELHPANGTWSTDSELSGMQIQFSLKWTADSVSGDGTYSGGSGQRCGTATVNASGTVRLGARRSPPSGTMTFSGGQSFEYLGYLADSARLVGSIINPDHSGCAVVLTRDP